MSRSTAVHACAELGIADLLQAGPKSTAQLAEATDTDHTNLYRLLRLLVAMEILDESAPGLFQATPLSRYLQREESLYHLAMMAGTGWVWKVQEAAEGTGYSLHSGRPALNQLFGMDIWSYLQEHPQNAAHFHRAMSTTVGAAEGSPSLIWRRKCSTSSSMSIQPDNYAAAGQVIPVAGLPGAATVGILGTSTAGSSSGTATLTYTDGSTQTFSLGMSDWTNATPLYGNTIAASMSYYNRSSGKQTRNIYLFTSEVSLTPGKTLRSVTLPTTTTPAQIHIFAVGTRSTLNNLGTSNDSQPGEDNFDGGGNSWSIQALAAAGVQPGQPFVFNGTTFTWPASYGSLADNDQSAGQALTVTPIANATTLGFLGAATYGSSSGAATITYTDGSTQAFTLGFSDWTLNGGTSQPSFGNSIGATVSYRNTPSGQQTVKTYVFYANVAVQAGKTIQSVILPATVSQGALHVFAIGTK